MKFSLNSRLWLVWHLFLLCHLAGSQSTEIVLNGQRVQTPDYPLFGVRYYGSSPGQVLGFNNNGILVPMAAPSGSSSSASSMSAAGVSSAYGVVQFGDSYTSCVGMTTLTNCWASLLSQHLGYGATSTMYQVGATVGAYFYLTPNTVQDAAGGGATSADESAAIWSFKYQPSDSGNPIVTEWIGANNVQHFATPDPIGYQSDLIGNLSFLALSKSNFVAPSNCTAAGTSSADTYFPAFPGVLLGAVNSTLSCAVQIGTPGVFYLYVRDYGAAGSTGTINVKVDGVVQTESISATSVLNTLQARFFSTSPADGVIGWRFAGLSPGAHTILITDLSGTATVQGIGIPPSRAAMGGSAPAVFSSGPGVVGSSSSAYAAQMAAFTTLHANIVAMLSVTDGLAVFNVPTSAALDPIVDFSATATTNPICPATTAAGHFNDCGHRHADQIFESIIGAATPSSNPVFQNVTANSYVGSALSMGSGSAPSAPIFTLFDGAGDGGFLRVVAISGDANVHVIATAPVSFQGNQAYTFYEPVNMNAGGQTIGLLHIASVFQGSPANTGSGQTALSGAVVAASMCGSLAGAAGCLTINTQGTLHYVPYY